MRPRSKNKVTAVDQDKRRQRRVLIFSLLMVGLMVLSVAEIVLYGGDLGGKDRMVYGKYTFSVRNLGNGAGGVLVTSINNQEVEFQNLPIQVGYLDVDSHAIELLKLAQVVVLSADTNLSQVDAATVDYTRLQLGLAIPKTMNAMTEESDIYQLPVINCSRASAQSPVVIFNITNETSVRSYDNCIYINAEASDLLRVKDRLIFEYIGILSNGQVVD